MHVTQATGSAEGLDLSAGRLDAQSGVEPEVDVGETVIFDDFLGTRADHQIDLPSRDEVSSGVVVGLTKKIVSVHHIDIFTRVISRFSLARVVRSSFTSLPSRFALEISSWSFFVSFDRRLMRLAAGTSILSTLAVDARRDFWSAVSLARLMGWMILGRLAAGAVDMMMAQKRN